MVLTPTQSLSCRERLLSSCGLSRPGDWWAECGEAPPRLPEPLPLLPERGRARPPPPIAPVAQAQPESWKMVRKRRLYFRAGLEGRWGRVGPTGLGGRQGQLRRRRQVALAGELGAGLRGLGVRLWDPGARPRWPAPPFPCPRPPRGRPAPAHPPLRGAPGTSRPLCLGPSGLHPGLSTSPARSSGVVWFWAGTCPPSFSSSAFSLRRRGRGEEEERGSV